MIVRTIDEMTNTDRDVSNEAQTWRSKRTLSSWSGSRVSW